MRILVIATSLAVLSACGPAPKGEPAAEETVAAAEETSVSNGSGPGTYVVTGPDGTEFTTVINADGTYSGPAEDGSVIEGTWAVVNGKTCFTTKEEGAKPECWTESAPGEDGSFTATSDTGETVTVRPAQAAAPAAAPAAAAEGAEPIAAE